jgi:hypothetical protein
MGRGFDPYARSNGLGNTINQTDGKTSKSEKRKLITGNRAAMAFKTLSD